MLECNQQLFLLIEKKIYQFKAKDSEKKRYSLCFGNIFQGFTVDFSKKTKLNGYVHDISVDHYQCITIDISDFEDIRNWWVISYKTYIFE